MPMSLPEQDTNPGSAYPPTRPSLVMVILALVVLVSVVGIVAWPQLSAHLQLGGLEPARPHAKGVVRVAALGAL
jgi:hypothetical protein